MIGIYVVHPDVGHNIADPIFVITYPLLLFLFFVCELKPTRCEIALVCMWVPDRDKI
jgi:hypothetical protein